MHNLANASAGVVVMMLDTKMEPAIAKNMLRGAVDPLWSEFRLGYAGCARLRFRAVVAMSI